MFLSDDTNSVRVSPLPQFLNRFIYVSLLALIVLTAIPYGTVQPWWIAAFQCAVFVLATLAVVEAHLSKSQQIDVWQVVPLLCLIGFALVQSVPLFQGPEPLRPQTALSADPYSTRLFAFQLFALTLVVILIVRYIRSRQRLRNLIFVVIGVGVVSAVFGIMRQQFQHAPGFVLPDLPIGNRSFGQFINRNHFALLLEMCLGLSLGLILSEARRNRRLLALPVSGLLWIALIFSNSRGGIIASLCQLVFFAVLVDPLSLLKRENESRSRLRNFAGNLVVRAVLIVVLVGLFAYGVTWIGGEPVISNFQLATTDFSEQEMANNTNTSRKEIWSATWRMFKNHPVAGMGFGAYWIGITRYHRASGEISPQQAHNDYLELLASGGLIACALVIWFLVIIGKAARYRLNAGYSDYRAACIGALTGLFGAAVHSFVDFGIHITINALVLFTLIAIVLLRPEGSTTEAIGIRERSPAGSGSG
jgi:O-antigen ligase